MLAAELKLFQSTKMFPINIGPTDISVPLDLHITMKRKIIYIATVSKYTN